MSFTGSYTEVKPSFQSSRNRMQIFERKKEISGVSKNRAFEKSGVKLQCLTEANPRETTFGSKNREFRITEYSKNRDSTVYPHASNSCVLRGVPTLRIFVSGEPQNLFVNLKILPGIGSLEKLFGKLQIILEYYIIYLGLASNFVLFSGDVSFCLRMVNCKL